ncbi:L-aspartate oxidase [Thermomonas alba]|uniref:L-aspartate oxidase n=1 Tax=Thermomonas alba TaxID=2888525 RepID=UPI001F0447E0|nr:FAD-binding protein [Thermomonas alba]
MPIIVVGGGIAGLVTAIAAAPTPVLLLQRSPQSASRLAQGGIAAAVAANDSAQAHAHDTAVAGSFHNDAAIVDLLTRGAASAIHWLETLGVVFDRDADGNLQLAREGGHGQSRIVHAGGDATGARVMDALLAEARRSGHVTRWSSVEVDGLMLRGDHVCGVCLTREDGSREALHGRAVVIATGGIGGLFAQTSNPAEADGSGLALALTVAATMRDLEFVQFHPTALALPGRHSLPLVTEALRGAGARLLDSHGVPLMARVHPMEDLAPRDVVARRVWQAGRQGGAWLDARGIGSDFQRRFPTVFEMCMSHGIDPRQQPIPVTAAAHFHMGGIAVDADGCTSMPGLYAVGEVACNGVHGANRLASNSLLEGIVFGRRLGMRLRSLPDIIPGSGNFRLVRRGPALTTARLTQLRELLMAAMGPVRRRAVLREASQECLALAKEGWQGGVACALIEAALRRTHNLGAHHWEDAEMPGQGASLRQFA